MAAKRDIVKEQKTVIIKTMTYPARIRKKILAGLEDSTYREVAARHRISHNPKAAAVLRPAFSQEKSSGKTSPSTLMTINGKGRHA